MILPENSILYFNLISFLFNIFKEGYPSAMKLISKGPHLTTYNKSKNNGQNIS